jgi:hypothetical protein
VAAAGENDGLDRVASQLRSGRGLLRWARFSAARSPGATRPSRNRSAISFSFSRVMASPGERRSQRSKDRTYAESSRRAVHRHERACAH